MIDETTVASVRETDVDARDAFWWTAIWLWSLWNVGSIGSALLGSVIGAPETWGRAAFPAAFVALLGPHIRKRPGQMPPWSELRLRLRSRRSHPPVSAPRGGAARSGLAGRARKRPYELAALIVLVVGAYGLKAFGVLVLGRPDSTLGARFEPLTSLIPAALFADLIAVQTVGGDETLLDARVWGGWRIGGGMAEGSVRGGGAHRHGCDGVRPLADLASMESIEQIRVRGEGPLGNHSRRWRQNSVLKLMAATLLAEGTYHLRNVPRITDLMSDLLCATGCSVAAMARPCASMFPPRSN